MNVLTVSSLAGDELRPYATLRRPRDHYAMGLFVGEGEKVFDRLLQSSVSLVSVLLTPGWFERKRASLERYAPDATIYLADQALLESIVGFRLHQGIMAVGRVPPAPVMESLFSSSATPRTFLALDGLVNAENVGVVARNAAAFGVTALIVGETSSSPYLRRAVRNSMGAVFSLPVFQSLNLTTTLRLLRGRRPISILALELAEKSKPLHTFDLTQDLCLVLGNEGSGVRRDVIDACDACAEIPMQRGVDSLNVANASAVALYEVWRQRSPRSNDAVRP